MTKTSLLGIVFFLVSIVLMAQKPIVIGQTYKIHSAVLNEEREIEVQLPKNYDNPDFSPANYPVLYVLDGESNFQFVSAIERFDTKFLYRPHPEMIVVGIRNADRIRDFTPTNAQVIGRNGETRFGSSGGADNFLNFIQEELKPYINANYRTNGYDILHGHSFGGLLAIYALLEKPNLFHDYIVIDPSLWWDDKIIFKQVENKWRSMDFQHRGLFVALAHEEPETAKDRFEHGTTIRKFCETIVKSSPGNELRTDWKYYPDYDHGAVPLPATMDALRFLFEGIQLPVKEIPKNPELINTTYKKLSQQLNFPFAPDESLLFALIQYVKGAGQLESSRKILEYATVIYPKSKQLQQLNQEL